MSQIFFLEDLKGFPLLPHKAEHLLQDTENVEESSTAKNTPLMFFRSGTSFTYVIHCRCHWRDLDVLSISRCISTLCISGVHRFTNTYSFIEPQRSQGMSKDCLVQPFVRKAALIRLSSTLSNCKNDPSNYGDSLMFLGRLFQ